MKKILIILSFVIAIVALALASTYFINFYYQYKSLKNERTMYPSTYFIEPSQSFVTCFKTDDCIKIKASACPPSKGGTETCVNKEHMQEYLSKIEELSGKEWEVNCPNIDNSTVKECSCVNGICSLVI